MLLQWECQFSTDKVAQYNLPCYYKHFSCRHTIERSITLLLADIRKFNFLNHLQSQIVDFFSKHADLSNVSLILLDVDVDFWSLFFHSFTRSSYFQFSVFHSVFLLMAIIYCYHYNMFYFVEQPFCLFVHWLCLLSFCCLFNY